MKMKKTIHSKFYEFSQNNSGGYFDVDDNVTHRVIIEAFSADEARAKIDPMIENQSGSCSCCGDRWSTYYAEEVDFKRYDKKGYPVCVYTHYKDYEKRYQTLYGQFKQIEKPTLSKEYTIMGYRGKIAFKNLEDYAQFMANAYGWCTPDVIIHYLDGTKKQIFKTSVED